MTPSPASNSATVNASPRDSEHLAATVVQVMTVM
jgi:hypothetical protein